MKRPSKWHTWFAVMSIVGVALSGIHAFAGEYARAAYEIGLAVYLADLADREEREVAQ